MNNKKRVGVIIFFVIIIIALVASVYLVDMNRMKNNEEVFFSTWGKKYTPSVNNKKDSNDKKEITDGINVVVTTNDKITDDTVWCGTFQLIWNDLKNEFAKCDVVFNPQIEVVKNLNKGDFDTSKVSEDSYYKVHGIPTLELKQIIENEIKRKFDETSDILDDFDFRNQSEDGYFLYTMLKKEFEFEKEFDELDNSNFGNYQNIEYFGINGDSKEELRKQVEVLYYNSKEDFAIKLLTKSSEEVILAKTEQGQTFKDIYSYVDLQSSKFSGKKNIGNNENVMIPNIEFKIKEEIKEVEKKPFVIHNGKEYIIDKALQTIELKLDKKGGKLKSEAGMSVKETAMIVEDKIREFLLNDTFTMFLKEKGKDMPYFVAKIADITKFQ